MSAIVERMSGARVLPKSDDVRATVTEWAAHLACDADLRTKAPEYRALADELLPVMWPKCMGDLGRCPADAGVEGVLRPCRHKVVFCQACATSAHGRTLAGLVACDVCDRDVDRIEWSPLTNAAQL